MVEFPEVHASVAEHQANVAEAMVVEGAVRHFKRHMHRFPNWVANQRVWEGLTVGEVKADIQTADWVPNRAAWRRRGFRNFAHAQEVLG